MPSNSVSAPHFSFKNVSLKRQGLSLGLITIGALMLPLNMAHAGPDACVVNGTTVTCSGDQSDGVSNPADYAAVNTLILNIHNLNQDIAPNFGGGAVSFIGEIGSDIIINVDTGHFEINRSPDNSRGIVSVATDASSTINFNGRISVTGELGHGIFNRTNNTGDATTTNMGDIFITDDDGRGIEHRIDDGNSRIVNRGNISALGSFTTGIRSATSGNGDVYITNYGDVISHGFSSEAVSVNITGTGDIFIAHKSGTISGTTRGIVTDGGDGRATLDISGSVVGKSGFAIDLKGDGDDIVNLNAGANIVGAIDFGRGNDGMGGTNANDIDTLNIGEGFNGVVTFADIDVDGPDDDDLQSAPEIINVAESSASILTNGGTQLAVVDKTGFAASGSLLHGLTKSVSNVLARGPRPGRAARNDHADGVRGFGYGTNTNDIPSGSRVWGAAFGGTERVAASANNTEISHNHGGFVVGVDTGHNETTLGIFGGYGGNNLKFGHNAGDLKFSSFFAGADLKHEIGPFGVEFSVFGGQANQTVTRNLGATSGVGEYDGWFIAPSVTVSNSIDGFNLPAVISLRTGYAGLFLDGYTETGTVASPLTVSARYIHQLNGRLQLELPQIPLNKLGENSFASLHAGVNGNVSLGTDNVNVSVAGGNLNFSAKAKNQLGGFIGAGFIRQSGSATFTTSAELQANAAGTLGAVGAMKLSVKF